MYAAAGACVHALDAKVRRPAAAVMVSVIGEWRLCLRVQRMLSLSAGWAAALAVLRSGRGGARRAADARPCAGRGGCAAAAARGREEPVCA